MTILEDLNVRDLLEPAQRIARASHVTVDELLSRSRAHHVVRARDALLWHLVHDCGFSRAGAGRLLGLHHTTVIDALHRIAGAKT